MCLSKCVVCSLQELRDNFVAAGEKEKPVRKEAVKRTQESGFGGSQDMFSSPSPPPSKKTRRPSSVQDELYSGSSDISGGRKKGRGRKDNRKPQESAKKGSRKNMSEGSKRNLFPKFIVDMADNEPSTETFSLLDLPPVDEGMLGTVLAGDAETLIEQLAEPVVEEHSTANELDTAAQEPPDDFRDEEVDVREADDADWAAAFDRSNAVQEEEERPATSRTAVTGDIDFNVDCQCEHVYSCESERERNGFENCVCMHKEKCVLFGIGLAPIKEGQTLEPKTTKRLLQQTRVTMPGTVVKTYALCNSMKGKLRDVWSKQCDCERKIDDVLKLLKSVDKRMQRLEEGHTQLPTAMEADDLLPFRRPKDVVQFFSGSDTRSKRKMLCNMLDRVPYNSSLRCYIQDLYEKIMVPEFCVILKWDFSNSRWGPTGTYVLLPAFRSLFEKYLRDQMKSHGQPDIAKEPFNTAMSEAISRLKGRLATSRGLLTLHAIETMMAEHEDDDEDLKDCLEDYHRRPYYVRKRQQKNGRFTWSQTKNPKLAMTVTFRDGRVEPIKTKPRVVWKKSKALREESNGDEDDSDEVGTEEEEEEEESEGVQQQAVEESGA